MASSPVDVVWVNGTVGAGKSTVAEEISRQESDSGVVHALIDVDAVRGLRPPPSGDRFQFALQQDNLRDLASNYRAAGAGRLILAGVLEDAGHVDLLGEALGAERMLVVRLTTTPEVLSRRLRERHRGDLDGLAWHLRRAPELQAVLESASTEEVTLDTSDVPPVDLARRIRALAGW